MAHSEPLKIEATGQQWLWRYEYPNKAFSYYKLVVPVDTAVDLDLVSTDVIHTWDVPNLPASATRSPESTPKWSSAPIEEGVYRRPGVNLLGPGLRGDADRG